MTTRVRRQNDDPRICRKSPARGAEADSGDEREAEQSVHTAPRRLREELHDDGCDYRAAGDGQDYRRFSGCNATTSNLSSWTKPTASTRTVSRCYATCTTKQAAPSSLLTCLPFSNGRLSRMTTRVRRQNDDPRICRRSPARGAEANPDDQCQAEQTVHRAPHQPRAEEADDGRHNRAAGDGQDYCRAGLPRQPGTTRPYGTADCD